MFTNVHHVTYVVEDVDQVAEYMERNFGIKPEVADEAPDKGYKFIVYWVGSTYFDFVEPTTDDTATARFLKEHGPGLSHVVWGVDGIDQVFQDLKSKGNVLQANQANQDGPSSNIFGIRALHIDPGSAHGVYWQLAEGEGPHKGWKYQGPGADR